MWILHIFAPFSSPSPNACMFRSAGNSKLILVVSESVCVYVCVLQWTGHTGDAGYRGGEIMDGWIGKSESLVRFLWRLKK